MSRMFFLDDEEEWEEIRTVDSGDEYPISGDDSTESSESETDSEEQEDRVGRQGRKRARTEPDSSGERDICRGATNGLGRARGRGRGRGRGQASRGRGTGRRRGSQPPDGDSNPRAAPQAATDSDTTLDDRNLQRVDGNSLTKPPHVFTGQIDEREVAKELISTSGHRNASSLLRLTERHFPEKIPSAEGGKAKSRSCKVCCPAERKYRLDHGLEPKKRPGHESTYQCKQCEVALCITPCMELYHTQEFYIKEWIRLEYGPNAVADD
ncbi:PREDICTED: zinc finger Ran-binding domain-containing protein 2-like [Branchiostoma belcheri]|uniref:Zinc finger Ran-binding domain-containing protein 2-like n=1 Tax=Branchiostoma belcheri TaxID=7741 RepID=A0A6P4ZRK9_BRABE|nr:PREDICTED: zinc finger Ran-binding domain-containing protein 2-like [Branchiostoma belcheri]